MFHVRRVVGTAHEEQRVYRILLRLLARHPQRPLARCTSSCDSRHRRCGRSRGSGTFQCRRRALNPLAGPIRRGGKRRRETAMIRSTRCRIGIRPPCPINRRDQVHRRCKGRCRACNRRSRRMMSVRSHAGRRNLGAVIVCPEACVRCRRVCRRAAIAIRTGAACPIKPSRARRRTVGSRRLQIPLAPF